MLEVRSAASVANSHVRMISGACGRRSIGNVRAKRSGSSSQPVAICGRERRRRPRVHHVGIADEPTGRAALVFGVARRGRRSTGRPGAGPRSATIGGSKSGSPSALDRVPDRERHAEEPLPADQPVGVEALDPASRSAHACAAGASAEPARVRGACRAARRREPPLRMYHCRLLTISSGRSPFSKNFTGCVIGFGSPTRSPDSCEHLDDPPLRLLRGLARELGVARVGLVVDVVAPRGRRLGSDRRAPSRCASGVGARATTPRRWCHRRCRSSRSRIPSRDRRAGARAPAPARRTAACVPLCRTAADSARRRDGRRARRTRGSARVGSSR